MTEPGGPRLDGPVAALAEAVDDAVAGWDLGVEPPRVVGADSHDFASLYTRHRSSFSAHARRFLRDQRDVDEVVQESFLRLFLALPELETELQALSYCRRTITNLCIDRYRADQRRPRIVDLDSLPPEALPDDEFDDPVVRAEDVALVRHALSLLSPHHREALVKREVEEKPLPVIASEMAVPEERVKHLLHRARRALRRHLAATHLAPGVDLDETSTLRLLGRSAGASGRRMAALILVGACAALGASAGGPVEALRTVWGQGRPPPLAAERVTPQLGAQSARPPATHPPPVVRAEDAALVRHALSLLSPHHREALVKRE
ncbi:MAG: RNA polymerase sigma factor, partial [Actinomycetota bacterium]|nr:RNA polymerase sigma factor [Actinomycetota bacterium]